MAIHDPRSDSRGGRCASAIGPSSLVESRRFRAGTASASTPVAGSAPPAFRANRAPVAVVPANAAPGFGSVTLRDVLWVGAPHPVGSAVHRLARTRANGGSLRRRYGVRRRAEPRIGSLLGRTAATDRSSVGVQDRDSLRVLYLAPRAACLACGDSRGVRGIAPQRAGTLFSRNDDPVAALRRTRTAGVEIPSRPGRLRIRRGTPLWRALSQTGRRLRSGGNCRRRLRCTVGAIAAVRWSQALAVVVAASSGPAHGFVPHACLGRGADRFAIGNSQASRRMHRGLARHGGGNRIPRPGDSRSAEWRRRHRVCRWAAVVRREHGRARIQDGRGTVQQVDDDCEPAIRGPGRRGERPARRSDRRAPGTRASHGMAGE